MSIYNRDYMRDSRGGASPGHPSNWSVITKLIVINCLVYLVVLLIDVPPKEPLTDILSLSLSGLSSLKIWTLFTYQFIHGHLLHIAGNMVGLFFIGRILLQMVSPRQFMEIYFVGALFGGILQLLFNLATGQDGLIMGASGAVMAVLLALATLIPNQSLNFLLFFILPVKMTMRQIATIVIILDVLGFLFSFVAAGDESESREMIAHFAHFGGMLTGWAYIKFWFTKSQSSTSSRSRTQKLKKRFGISRIREVRMNANSGEKKSHSDTFVSSDVDAILDKINDKGFQSLTKEEQKLLEKSSRKLSKRIDKDQQSQ